MGKINMEQFLNYKKIVDVKELITQNQYYEIEKLFLWYDTSTIKNRLDSIRQFILCGVETKWLGRLRIITRKLKNDVLSEYACKIRYGDNWEEKQNILKEKVKMDKSNFIKKYGEIEGIKKWEERNKKVISYGLEPMVKRYGKVEGKKRWESALQSKIDTMSKRKLIEPYRNGRTLPEYQNRYGIEDGYNEWYERNKRQSYRLSLEGYIEKYGKVQGTLKWEEFTGKMDKTSLKSFISRYGEKLGEERYDNFIKKSKYIKSKEFFIEKYGEIEGEIKYKELILDKISNFKEHYSKISQDLFWNIYDRNENKDCRFYELNGEYKFFVWENGMTIILVDFKIGNKIIEFDGDYWHSKPDQIEKDRMRDDFLIKKGYIIKRVKEIDYNTNKELVIRECLDFLNNY